MNDEEFWSIIAASRVASDGTFGGRVESLDSHLSALSPEQIAAFQRIFDRCMNRAYTWDLWGAAYVIGGGCSNDGFTDFRSWLISMGRATYERALADPESLADLAFGLDAEEDAFFEEFAYVASRVYEDRTGESMPYVERTARSDPAGKRWAEDGHDLLSRFPRLWAKYGQV